jgi:hypothetical protein
LRYLCGPSESVRANSSYSAAVQAGSQSGKAFFHGSCDAGNSIAVDKPPAALRVDQAWQASFQVAAGSSWYAT